MAAGAVTRIDSGSLEGGGLVATGNAARPAGARHWQEARVSAALAGRALGEAPGHVTVSLDGADPGYRFQIASDDAGALFRALELYGDAEGGKLAFAGTADPSAPGQPLSGHLDVERFTLTKAPFLARVATLASLPGISEAVTGGQGIAFEALTAEISRRHGVVTVSNARAVGRSLGLTMDATIDHPAGTASARGTVVPALYGLNRALTRVPIVGRVIDAGRKGGALGVDFTVEGPIADPRVSVHPLESLTPDIVRSLLDVLPSVGGAARSP
jgi:hypothetical protein